MYVLSNKQNWNWIEWQSCAQKVLIATFELAAGHSDATLQIIWLLK